MYRLRHVGYLFAILHYFCLLYFSSMAQADTSPAHAFAMHGSPKYSADFKHFDYVNPAAIKGGKIKMATVSSSGFDSLNPYIIKGVSASGLTRLGRNYFYDSLTVQSDDEAFTQYGLIAERMEMPKDRSWVIFYINPKARFHDGKPITAQDVVYSFELLTQQGHPLYGAYYHDVIKSEILAPLTVKFSFLNNENRELPLIVGQLPILPKHYWQGRTFNKSSLEIPVGSGAYRIKSLEPGRAIIYELIQDYWGQSLPVNRGINNFDEVSFDYYRDSNVALEALKAGEYDFRLENTAKTWMTGYTGPPFDRGDLIREELHNENPTGMQGFVMNSRRWQFKDRRVRQALAYAFDFEWTNKQLFSGAYSRTESFYSNSDLAAVGLPSAQELAILHPFKDQVPEAVFTTTYQPPSTRGDGNIRNNLRQAKQLFTEAGWKIKDNKLTHEATGQVMTFEIMLVTPEFQRIVLPFIRNLERMGIQAHIRLVDPQQYINRLNQFDFDMVSASFAQSNSPGNEQRDFWNSREADRPGSRNIAGIKSPVIDELIELVIQAPGREQLIYRTRALDRVLLWGHYVIPQYHNRSYRIAYWNKFEKPQQRPRYGLGLNTWWAKQKPEISD